MGRCIKIFIFFKFLFYGFSFSSVAFASYLDYSSFCTDSQVRSPLRYIFLDTEEGDKFDCKKIEKYLEAIYVLNKMSPVGLKDISLNITEKYWDASNLVNLISFPQDFERSNDRGEYVLNQQLSENYLAHEFGHSIFNEYLARYFPEFKLGIDQIKENNLISEKVKINFIKGDDDEAGRLFTMLEEREIETFTSDKVMLPIFHVVPMAELFSDLVSVLYAENLKAFSSAASGQHAGHVQAQENLARDFSHEMYSIGWEDSEAHNLYGPTRSYIGQNLKIPKDIKNKKILLEKILKVMATELVGTFPAKTNGTPEKLNLRLIKLLEKNSVFR